MLPLLDADALRRWCAAGVEALRAARTEIDGLNVYPVPDGDTGTNLLLTMQAVQEALDQAGPSAAEDVEAVVRGSLMGARGNSGVILSQVLRGLCEGLAGELDGGAGAPALRAGLERAAELAHGAVAEPVEGTALTVVRAAAYGARGDDLAAVARSARAAAERALARTPEQLPALRDAGVVDAGGRGLCVLLAALEAVVTGEGMTGQGGPDAVDPPPLVPRAPSGTGVREEGSDAFAYEVQFLLRETDDGAVARLREVLGALGDSLAVVGGDGLFNVHVHVDDVGAALEAAVEAGRPSRIRVTRFEDQRSAGAAHCAPVRAVVAVAPAPGLAALFRGGGAVPLEAATAPSTAEVLAAVRATGAREVVLLPNSARGRGVADTAAAAAGRSGQQVVVVATACAVQGLAALAVRDDALPLPDTARRMEEAAAATRWAEVTRAVRDGTTPAGPCRAGDAVGLLGGRPVLVGPDLEQVAAQLLDRLLEPGAELVTVLPGLAAPDGAADRLADRARRAGAEVALHPSGCPSAAFLLGAEA